VSADGVIVLKMDYDAKAAPWLAPNVTLALEFTPEEARTVAAELLEKAIQAESWSGKP
jgi:hypothetical protein